MAKIIAEETKQWQIFPADTIIRVRLVEATISDEDGRYGAWQKLNARFEVTGVPSGEFADMVGERIYGSIPFKLNDSPDNQLKQWCEALLGVEVGVGFELDTDDLVGRESRAIVRNFEKKNGTTGHGVDTLLPVAGSGGATVAAGAPVDAAAASAAAAWAATDKPATPVDNPWAESLAKTPPPENDPWAQPELASAAAPATAPPWDPGF